MIQSVILALSCNWEIVTEPQLHIVDLIFSQGNGQVVFHFSGIGDVTVYSFLKFQSSLGIASHVIALPVLSPVGTFSPVFFYVAVANG